MDTCRLKGIAALTAATFFFTGMIIFVKLSVESLPGQEIALARYVFGIVVIIAASKMLRFKLSGGDRGTLFLSGLTGAVGSTAYFVALGLAPMGVVVVISFTFPVFAAISSRLLLGEAIPLAKLPAVILPFIGVGMVMGVNLGGLSVGWGEFFALIDGAFTGFSIALIRKLRRNESASSIFFYFVLAGALIAAPLSLPEFAVPSGRGLMLLAGMAAFAMLGRVAMNFGFKYCQATEGSIISTFQVPLMAAIGWLFFQEPMSALDITGSALILGSCFWITYQIRPRMLGIH